MNKILKTIIPHIIVLAAISLFLYFVIFQAMMFTNNNGEFGYPELGIYDWSSILSILFPWFLILFVALETPLLIYQFVRKKIKDANL